MRKLIFTLAALFCTAFSTSAAFAQLMWEMTPYNVQIYYAFDDPSGALSTDAAQKQLLSDVQNLLDNRVGGFWQTAIDPAPAPLAKIMLANLDAVTADDVYKTGMSKLDKVLLLAVRAQDNGWTIQVCDFDVRLRYVNGVIDRQCGLTSSLAQSVFDALREGFAPIGKIDTVEKDTVVLRMRGGLLKTPSENLFQIEKDRLFYPMIRYNENDGSLKKVNPVDWTFFLTTDQTGDADDASSASKQYCRIESGMRNALSARRRGRVEALAVLVHPSKRSSVLKLVAQKEEEKVLRGYALYRVNPVTNENALVGYSDLNGEFVVKPDSVSPLHVYVIKNGEALLAKLPILPGSAPVITAPVSDDDLRLQAEGLLLGIQEEIIDQIIMREIAIARIEAKLEKGGAEAKEEARKILNEIRNMKSNDDFIRELQTKKARFITAEPAQQARINQMFDKTMKLLSEYMNFQRVQDLETRINNMK